MITKLFLLKKTKLESSYAYYIWHSKIFVLLAVKLQGGFIFIAQFVGLAEGLAFKTHLIFQINYQGFYEYWVCHFYLPSHSLPQVFAAALAGRDIWA